MSVEAHTNINDCSGDEELSLPWQQKLKICLLWCVYVWLYPTSLRGNVLTDTGARVLATALQHNKSLEELK